jgi:NhaP-type Na+/H+ or K+/H+ antiporter
VSEELLQGIAIVLALGMAAQWLAWRVRLPSILLLLVFGFAAGRGGLGWLDPHDLLGDLLLPVVSVSAAIILFEGGLTLGFGELKEYGKVVFRLVTVGLLVTWGLATAAALLLLGLSTGVSVLLGAILTVSGPTVVMPLLRHIRPRGAVGTVLKWEGIVIDPLGAALAVLVFEGLLLGGFGDAAPHALRGIVLTIVVGGVIGLAGAWLLIFLLRRYWIPDYLHNPIALALVVASFVASNAIQPDSGLLTVTVLGVALANKASVSVRHIVEFKENLRVLLISSVFILLAAGVGVEDFEALDIGALAFVLLLILVVRPLSVLACTWGSSLTARERIFLSWLFPRGIVAAAVASVFALRLQEAEIAGADQLVPLTFLVIVGTVLVYGLTAPRLARQLGLATPNPQGVVLVGAHAWARDMAAALQEAGIEVLLVDTNRKNVLAARMAHLPAWYGSALAEHAIEEMDLSGMGRLFALTPNEEVNTLTLLHYLHLFGRERLYQLAPAALDSTRSRAVPEEFRGRTLFSEDQPYAALSSRYGRGARVKATPLTEAFGFEAFREHHGERALPLFTVSETAQLTVATADRPLKPVAGQVLIALVDPDPDASTRTDRKADAPGAT